MRHALYGKAHEASVAILVKEAAFDSDKIKKAYIDELGAKPEGFIAYSLWYNDSNKCPAELAKDYLKTVLNSLENLGIKIILVADSKYFKFLTKQTRASELIGCATKSKLEDYEDKFTVFYAPNYQAAKYNPATEQELASSMAFFKGYLQGNYVKPGENIIHSASYPKTLEEVKDKLDWLLTKPALTVDIETTGLKFYSCGISTIAFAWDKHNFAAFEVDRGDINIKPLLREFFEAYTGNSIAHNANFDFKVLAYELWMDNLQDYKGMIQGIVVLTKNFNDTKVITYLATNNAVENTLGLKALSSEYMGSYAENVKDTASVPIDDLLLYNGKDCLATWYVMDKYAPIMCADGQQDIYEYLFKPSIVTLLQTELVGLPIFMDKVKEVKKTLADLSIGYKYVLDNSSLVKEFQLDVQQRKCKEFTAEAKKKVFTMDDPRVVKLEFNPNSPQQVADLLYNYMGLPILDLTDTNQPATGAKVIKKLIHHTNKQAYHDIINALIDLSKVNKILSSFLPAFEAAVQMPDGSHRLYGNFNLGGTVSGRLSCVAGWTPILTNRGTIPITDVTIGDQVWTHDERWEPVTNTIYKGIDHMVNITLCNGEVFTCTIDHKVLLSSGEWKTIKEVLNVDLENLDKQPYQLYEGIKHVSVIEQRNDHGKDCQDARNNPTQRIVCSSSSHDKRRVEGNQDSEILSVQNRNKESHEGQDRRPTPQLAGGMRRLQGVPDESFQWKKGIRPSNCYDAGIGPDRVTREPSRTSHRQQSIEQRIRQSCINFQNRSQRNSSFAGRGQSSVEIKKIEYFGCTKVYDITVANSASYLSCGFYSHNSSDPNLQNIPSGSTWAELIKGCFGGSKGWLFGGADFNSLEDMISALTTRDPNKMKVYLDGYDGHCLRAYSYFGNDMPDIVNTVASINSIKTKYHTERKKSKAPTFLLTYQGTYHGLMNNLGLSKAEALQIEANYHDLYKVSDEWVANKLQIACSDGFVTGAFGLRLRTPLLKMNGPGKLQYRAAAEGRTAGNMLGQSYGMLNSRAANEFRKRVWESPYRYDILPCGQIHDAVYFIWKNTVGVTKWLNDNLIDCMKWDGLVELQHPIVKVGAALDIFYPDWATATTLKNGLSMEDIFTLCKPETK